MCLKHSMTVLSLGLLSNFELTFMLCPKEQWFSIVKSPLKCPPSHWCIVKKQTNLWTNYYWHLHYSRHPGFVFGPHAPFPWFVQYMLSSQFEPQILRIAYANGCWLVGWLRRLYTSGCPVGTIVCTVCSVCPVACCLLHGEVHLVCVWLTGLLYLVFY